MSRQAIHADQVIAGLARLHLLGEQLFDGGPRFDIDVVGETGAVIVYLC